MSHCPHCQHQNPPGTRFCAQCGAGLEIRIDEDKSAYTTPVAPGTIFDGKYQVLQEIGRGGMGVVYRGHDLSLGRMVAIKVLPEQFNTDDEVIARFKKEARAMAALDHPNIVPVYAIGQQRNFHYFVMKFLEGATVAEHLEAMRAQDPQNGRFEPAQVRRLVEQACRGLDHAHKRGLVHRDVKPGNLMVSPDNHCTIMDFGIVKEQRAAEALTREGLVFGTPEYMAPEQAQGQQLPEATADIYSLGVVAYEMLAGRPPFQADTPFSIVLKHIKEMPASLAAWVPGVTSAFEAVLFRALAKRPEDRFSTAMQMAEALDQLVLGAQSLAPRAALGSLPPPSAVHSGAFPSPASPSGLGRTTTAPPPMPPQSSRAQAGDGHRLQSGPPPRVHDRPSSMAVGPQVLMVDDVVGLDDFEDAGEPEFLAPPAPFFDDGFGALTPEDLVPEASPVDVPRSGARIGGAGRASVDRGPPAASVEEHWQLMDLDDGELQLDLPPRESVTQRGAGERGAGERGAGERGAGAGAGERGAGAGERGAGAGDRSQGGAVGSAPPRPAHSPPRVTVPPAGRTSVAPRPHVPVNTPRADAGRSDPAVIEDRPGHYRHLVTASREDVKSRARARRRNLAMAAALVVGLVSLIVLLVTNN